MTNAMGMTADDRSANSLNECLRLALSTTIVSLYCFYAPNVEILEEEFLKALSYIKTKRVLRQAKNLRFLGRSAPLIAANGDGKFSIAYHKQRKGKDGVRTVTIKAVSNIHL